MVLPDCFKNFTGFVIKNFHKNKQLAGARTTFPKGTLPCLIQSNSATGSSVVGAAEL